MAGITALLNQYLVQNGVQTRAGLGNINPKLYALAQTTPSVFHDVLMGNNMVTLCGHHGTCSSTPIGFNAGPGYDQVTGLGSIDAYRLVTAWTGASPPSSKLSASVSVVAAATSIGQGDSTTLTATVQGTGSAPTGTVSFTAGSSALGSVALVANGSTSTATLTLSGSELSIGSNTIAARYSGDASYDPAFGNVALSVTGAGGGAPSITGLSDGASYRQIFAPGQILTIWGTQLAPSAASASTLPLPASLSGVSVTMNGVPAPLYYASSTQLNVQIPYESTTSTFATVTVSNNGQTASAPLYIQRTAPGIFVDAQGAAVPRQTARAGDTVFLYITGAGSLSPLIPTGSAPAAGSPLSVLPRPTASYSVTVDGLPAQVAFIGETPGLVGVVQVNYTIPSGVQPGVRPVMVRVGGTASAAATVTVTP
jgi:uncharacterized protein (TIGR03437 family)